MFKSCHFTKYFIKLGAFVCMSLRSERREVNWSYFSFPIWPFRIKRKRKDVMSVSSCNSVNSAIMHNMEIMITMSFVITLISRAIMIIIFLDSTKFKIVWLKITTFFKRRVSIIL